MDGSVAAWLAGYHRARDHATLSDYHLNAQLARTMAAPEQLLRASYLQVVL